MSAQDVMSWAAGTGMSITILIAFILIIRRPFTRYFGSHAAYALWTLPVIRLLMPEMTLPFISAFAPQSTPRILLTSFDFVPAPVPEAVLMQAFPIMVVLLVVWLGGAVIMLLGQALRQNRYMRQIRQLPEPSIDIMSDIERAVRVSGLKRTPEFRLSNDNTGPLVAGLIRPVIILPKDFTEIYSAHQRHFALVHECTHIRRADLWAAFAALIFRAINWPNPLVHYAARAFRVDQEAACDAAVMRAVGEGHENSTHSYAETLLHAAKNSNTQVAAVPLGLTIHHPLKERLMTLKTNTCKTGLLSRLAAASTIVLALAATAPLTMASAHPGETSSDVDSKLKSKKVIKWTEKDDIGNAVSKHYEIITEDGETTAWEIDAFGNKTELETSDIKGLKGFDNFDMPGGKTKLKILGLGDSKTMSFHGNDDKRLVIKKLLKDGEFAFGEDSEFPGKLMGENRELFLKQLTDGKHGKVFTFSSEDDMEITSDLNSFVFGGGGHTKSLVTAAESMLSKAKTDELSSNARRKLEKAQRALEEAKEALEADD